MLLAGMKSNKLKIKYDGADNPSEVRAYDVADKFTNSTSSSVAYTNYTYEAFDGITGSSQWAPNKPSDGWIYWTFNDPIIINKAGIWGSSFGTFRIEGSTEETPVNWVTLLESPAVAKNTYSWVTWVNNTEYKHYRLYLYGIGNVYMGISDIIYVEAGV